MCIRDSFYPRLMSVACRFVPEHIAEDIVQSVVVMYWEQKSALIPNAIHSFLYKCTQNKCLNYLKHQAVVLGHEEEVRLAEERMAFQLAGSDAIVGQSRGCFQATEAFC